jgi:DNA-binding transcriptional MerR regulator
MKDFLRSGELATRTGVSVDTLRHYEAVGVLPPPRRGANGYREYPESAVARVTLVRRALALEFTLAELSRILAVRDAGGTPCRTVRALAATKLARLERELEDLRDRHDRMRATIAQWDRQLATGPRGKPARLLDGLGEGKARPTRRFATRRD